MLKSELNKNNNIDGVNIIEEHVENNEYKLPLILTIYNVSDNINKIIYSNLKPIIKTRKYYVII